MSTGSPSPRPFFTTAEIESVNRFYREQGAAPTPLRRLPALAAALGAGEILIKDESLRFGLPAFKIAGVQYAVATMIESGSSGRHDLACATAGNHGRAVARVARERGLGAHVFVPAGTAASRVAALRGEGADVVVTEVDYDKTVRVMARESAARDWTIVSDTAWPGYEQIPRSIMAGYTVIFEEAADEWGAARPDLVMVQAGVGSLAGAAAAWLEHRYGAHRPHFVVAEPEGSACVLASLDAGRRTALASPGPTAMVGLRCAEVSSVAWEALRDRVDAAIAVPESVNDDAMTRLASPAGSDPAIQAGASGACGVAALMMLLRNDELAPIRTALRITGGTRVLAIVTEGTTDR